MNRTHRLVIALFFLGAFLLLGFLLAKAAGATESPPLPFATPAATAADWHADASAADARARAAARAPDLGPPPSGIPWGAIGSVVLGLLGTGFTVAKTASSANPLARLATGFAEGLWRTFAHRDAKQADDLAAQLADRLRAALDEMRQDNPDLPVDLLAAQLLKGLPAYARTLASRLLSDVETATIVRKATPPA